MTDVSDLPHGGEPVDCVVIGAGAVGLAVARALALAGREVMVLEQHSAVGTETSARNSEVLHAGMYYPAGSLKARLCVQGNAMLRQYAAQKGFGLQRVGKLIVATDDSQLPALDALYQQAQANGVPGMSRLTGAQAMGLEPQLYCVAALHSASTGIIDSHAYMLALQGDIESAGGAVVCRAKVQRSQITPRGTVLDVNTPDGDMRLCARSVVNCAGLYATQIAHGMMGFPAAHIPTPQYVKGNYFTLSGRSPFKQLIYPVPPKQHSSWLGVHLTLDQGGQARFGPDTESIDVKHPGVIDYTVDAARSAVFYEAVRQYWPGLPDGALQPAYSGVRPKVTVHGATAKDFIISTPAQHGVAQVVHLFGIESPGLTSSMALAQQVVSALIV